MLLCTVQRVLDDLGFDTSNMPNINKASAAALNFAEETLATALGTVFFQQTLTDQYFVKEPCFEKAGNVRTTFKLSQGFIDSTVPLIGALITKTDRINQAAENSDISANLSMLRMRNDATGFERGVVVDQTNNYSNVWVSITYKAGFPVGPDDVKSGAAAYDLTKVPEWLQTAAHLTARIFLQSNPSLEDPQIKLDTKLMQCKLDAILAGHTRYAPGSLLPDA